MSRYSEIIDAKIVSETKNKKPLKASGKSGKVINLDGDNVRNPEAVRYKAGMIVNGDFKDKFMTKAKGAAKGSVIGGIIGLIGAMYFKKSKLFGAVTGGLVGAVMGNFVSDYLNKK